MKLRLISEPLSVLAAKAGAPHLAQRAFTLVEAMCSAAIAAIVLLALFSGLNSGFTLTQMERENLRATQIALARMEGLRLYLWSSNQLFNPQMLPNTFTDYYYPSGIGGFSSNTVYTGSVTIANVTLKPSASYSTNMQQVIVKVGWQDAFYGRTNYHTRTFNTYVARWGIQNYIFVQQ
ncbi:MAG TPA: prepilin-type N-terminal cleavage/methylation domain-containing protein [Verrucomicrobiae bacterium]|nr:prepilin-type N-terminal cleavage/methylation domain-containing protein [Verrucomicrobiae bacterium]